MGGYDDVSQGRARWVASAAVPAGSGSGGLNNMQQPEYDGWSVGAPAEPQQVPHPRTGTGLAVGATVSPDVAPSEAPASGASDAAARRVSRETEDPPLAQEAERAVKILNPRGEDMPRP